MINLRRKVDIVDIYFWYLQDIDDMGIFFSQPSALDLICWPSVAKFYRYILKEQAGMTGMKY